MSEDVTSKQIGTLGEYQIIFKSGATAILSNVELWADFSGDKPQAWNFQRDKVRVSYTAHVPSPPTGAGQKPLDEVIDAILKLK